MSQVDIVVPSVGESITEATIEEWQKKAGDYVEKDEVLVVLETDKASVELVAEASGTLNTLVEDGEQVNVGAKIGAIDSSAAKPTSTASSSAKASNAQPSELAASSSAAVPAAGNSPAKGVPGPAAKHLMGQHQVALNSVEGTGPKGNITKGDVLNALEKTPASPGSAPSQQEAPAPLRAQRGKRREKMSTLRKRIAERLVQAQQTAAILTTFNEVDMSALIDLRARYKDAFEKKHGTRLGFMGFFVKSVCEALKEFPAVNAQIEGTEIVYNDFVNMGIAVGGPKGLVVPVVKDADLMSLSEIESTIRGFAVKAKENKLTIDDLTGGTFTISNGGVYGSLMSTPILNPPQSGILGMHKIEERPVAINGKVEVRPMMYLALSYDHRVIDGKESVSFLVRIKEGLEDPSRLLLGV